MTTPLFHSRALSLHRAGAVAKLRMIRLLRTRRLLLALLMTLLPWLVVEQAELLPRLVALAEFTVVGVTVLVAGALADDLDGGHYAIVLTHDGAPREILVGEGVAALALAVLFAALQLPVAFHALPIAQLGAVLACLAWLVALLAGWVALMLLLATVLPGVGNGFAMIPILTVLPVLSSPALLDRLPAWLSALARCALQLIPTPQQTSRIFEALLAGIAVPRVAGVVLLAAPVVFFVLAASRLDRLEPAGRIVA